MVNSYGNGVTVLACQNGIFYIRPLKVCLDCGCFISNHLALLLQLPNQELLLRKFPVLSFSWNGELFNMILHKNRNKLSILKIIVGIMIHVVNPLNNLPIKQKNKFMQQVGKDLEKNERVLFVTKLYVIHN